MPKKLLLLPPLSVSSAFRAPRASPAARQAMNAARTGYRVFSANSTAACTELAKRITERLGAELGKSVVYQETNGETRVEIKESVRGQDIFIIQTIPRDVNTAVMELLIMAYALKTACARNIIGVIPYFPYSKQSKMRKRGSIVCKLLASMLAKAGLTHIITMDLHQKEIQGFFSFPVDNLRASPFLLQYIQEEIPNYRNAVIVAKSPDAAKRAQSYAERLRLGLAVIHGEAQCAELDMDDGRHSPPMVKNATVHPGLELPRKINSDFYFIHELKKVRNDTDGVCQFQVPEERGVSPPSVEEAVLGALADREDSCPYPGSAGHSEGVKPLSL